MLLQAFDRTMREWFAFEAVEGADRALNGLQVGRSSPELRKIALAVDASQESFRRAAEWKADLLFVHHGLFWGDPLALTGNHYRRIKLLLDHDLALYALHLPLDLHPELGNNAGIARVIGLKDLEPFGLYKGIKIGYKGVFPEAVSLSEVADRLCDGEERALSILPFGPDMIRTVGIVSGGGASVLPEAVEEGLDLYITGDAEHTCYHHSLEGRINVIFAGHYLTEIWGVKQVGEKIASSLGLETGFLDIPTGL